MKINSAGYAVCVCGNNPVAVNTSYKRCVDCSCGVSYETTDHTLNPQQEWNKLIQSLEIKIHTIGKKYILKQALRLGISEDLDTQLILPKDTILVLEHIQKDGVTGSFKVLHNDMLIGLPLTDVIETNSDEQPPELSDCVQIEKAIHPIRISVVHQQDILNSFDKLVKEIERQQNLFPIMKTDAWLPLAIANLNTSLKIAGIKQ